MKMRSMTLTWRRHGAASRQALARSLSMCVRARSGPMWAFRILGRWANVLSSSSGRLFPIKRWTRASRSVLPASSRRLASSWTTTSSSFAGLEAGAWQQPRRWRRLDTANVTTSPAGSKDRSTTTGIAAQLMGGKRLVYPGSKARATQTVGTDMTVRVEFVDCSSMRRAVRNGANDMNGKEQEPWHSKNRAHQAKLGRGSRAGYAAS